MVPLFTVSRPATAISGTPISSASLNLTPGDTFLRSSYSTSMPRSSSSATSFSAASNAASSLPVAMTCTWAGATIAGQTRPLSSWWVSAMQASTRLTPMP